MNWRAANGTEVRQLLCGRSTCGNVPHGTPEGKAEVLKFRRGSCWKQDGDASACLRRFNGLMAQMAGRAAVRQRGGVMMPDYPEGRPYQQRE
jgi:hypothetical protein